MPSREGGKVDSRSPWFFACGKESASFCPAATRLSSPLRNYGGIRCERQCWRWRRSARLGPLARSPLPGRRPFRHRGPITPRLKKPPAAVPDRVAHGDGLGSAAPLVAGALLAAAVIGTARGVTSQFGTLVSRLQSSRISDRDGVGFGRGPLSFGKWLGKLNEDDAGVMSGDW
jgi:hypothetical protein